MDLVLLQGADPAKGKIPDFKISVLEEALKRTEGKYGPYRYVSTTVSLSRERMLEELIEGRMINMSMTATQPKWEEKLLTVRIPVDMGLSGLRISLIRADAQPYMAAIRTVDALKSLSMGVGTGWASRKVAEANGFQVAPAETYDALLKMLMSGRSDYLPRSLNEAFSEYEIWHKDLPDLAIDQALLLNMPLPTYIFVSPKEPRLAKRIEEGMEMLVRDGTLQRIMLKFNADLIKRADLCKRTVFQIPNPTLSEATPLQRKEVWFDPFDPKRGICPRTASAGKLR
ncbi:hypothetical protein [Viridibacterium curvum]|uniref:Transporter substrate-binding domain-containing protein n=1 Tax=Viridibacterium curvum TaxID=1101404 RepID=A0ABP9QDM5_9RHOO